MKQLIVMTAVLPILFMLMMQISLDQKNSQVISVIQSVVYTAKEEAKQEGIFSSHIKEKIVDEISQKTGITRDKIKVEADNHIKYRYEEGKNRLINYKVVVEIDNVMVAPEIYGISKENNKYFYTIDSYTSSEKL